MSDRAHPSTPGFIDATPAAGGDPDGPNRVIGGELLAVLATLAAEGFSADLVLADPPWPSPFFEPDDDDRGAPDDAAWLAFLRRRLEALADLLRSTGVLAVLIDDRNLFRVGQLVDDVLGIDNRLTVVACAKAYAYGGKVGITFDHLVVAVKDLDAWKAANPEAGPQPQVWDIAALGDEPPAAGRAYETVGTRDLADLIGPHRYFHAKPVSLYRRILEAWCPSDGVVLDPFAGSGACGHAVLNTNDVNGSTRRFVLVDRVGPSTDGPDVARTITARRVSEVQRRRGGGPGFRYEVVA